MSTRGDITVVSEDHYYSHYQQTDMGPHGHIQHLLREAADIAQQEGWDAIAKGWTQKTWLVPEDDNLPKHLRNTVKHPDGDDYKRFDWSYGMRPRLTHAEIVDRGFPGVADDMFKQSNGTWAIWGSPSWRAAAELPAMLKEDFAADSDKAYGIVLDLDNREVVCLGYWPRPTGEDPEVVTLGVALIDDPAALTELADWASEFNNCADRATLHSAAATHAARDWGSARQLLRDGQWLRPSGFPELPDTPWEFPAQRHTTNSPAKMDSDGLRASSTSDGWATLRAQCTHVGIRNKKRCIRLVHSDGRHRYE